MEQELKEQRALGLKLAVVQPESNDPYANIPASERRFDKSLDEVTHAIWEEHQLIISLHIWTAGMLGYNVLLLASCWCQALPVPMRQQGNRLFETVAIEWAVFAGGRWRGGGARMRGERASTVTEGQSQGRLATFESAVRIAGRTGSCLAPPSRWCREHNRSVPQLYAV